MATSTVPMTGDVGDFITMLRPGDVLLFDTLHPLSDLIKFAENRPANHCALFLGEGKFAHVGRHIPALDGKGLPVKPAARIEDLTAWLSVLPPHDRTVTALRHPMITSAKDATPVIERANFYAGPADTLYNYVSLMGLMVPSLLRTYKNSLGTQGAMGLAVTTMKAFSQSLVQVLMEDADRTGRTGSRTLTCSEFIYRCFDEGDKKLTLDVTDPLGRWPDPQQLLRPADPPPPGPANPGPFPFDLGPGFGLGNGGPNWSGVVYVRAPDADGGSQEVDGEGVVDFHGSFKTDVLGPVSITVGEPELWENFQSVSVQAAFLDSPRFDLAKVAAKAIVDMIKGNRDIKKYDEAVRSASKGEVFADLVTPRDLWASPTLHAAAVLHRPPSDLDVDLDGPPRSTKPFAD